MLVNPCSSEKKNPAISDFKQRHGYASMEMCDYCEERKELDDYPQYTSEEEVDFFRPIGT